MKRSVVSPSPGESAPETTSAGAVEPGDNRTSGKRLARRRTPAALAERFALLGVWAVVVLIFSIAEPSTYPTTATWQNIFGSQAVLVVISLAVVVPLTTGDFDLSVASILGFAAMITAEANTSWGWSIVPAMLLAIAAATAVGWVNGALVAGLGLNSFIVTLGTGTFVNGLVLWISNSTTVTGISSSLENWVIIDRFLGVSLIFWYAIALVLVLGYLFEFTVLGRRMLVVGRGRLVARLSGLRVRRIRWGALTAAGAISGLAGVLYAGTTGGADPTASGSFLLPAFAAAFLGATTIIPGRFNAWGTLAAVYFLVSGITGLQQLGINTFVQQLFYGGALVIAIAMSHLVGRRRQGQDEDALAADDG